MYAISLRICSLHVIICLRVTVIARTLMNFQAFPMDKQTFSLTASSCKYLRQQKLPPLPPPTKPLTTQRSGYAIYVSTTLQSIVSTRFVLRMGMVCILYIGTVTAK